MVAMVMAAPKATLVSSTRRIKLSKSSPQTGELRAVRANT